MHPHRVAGEAVARRLDAEDSVRVVGVAVDEAGAMNVVKALGPDVAVAQTESQQPSALRFVATLAAQDPPVRVIALIGQDDGEGAIRAIRAGARGVVTTQSSATDLAAAVVAVCTGSGWLESHLLGPVLRELRVSAPAPNEFDQRLARLTDREREVLDGLSAGCDRARIARDLMVSVGTVRTHTRNILAKLEVHSSLEAVSVALRRSSVPSA